MSNAVETFKQPFLSKVENILNKAVSITWEGCHKIYVCLDQESHKQQTECGYDMVLVGDKAEALDQLYEWFDVSCSLRFINAIECGDTFHDVIPQFDYDEEEAKYNVPCSKCGNTETPLHTDGQCGDCGKKEDE